MATTATANDARAFAIAVVERLRAAGFEALWAGGCVRDMLLGNEPKDYDVATNARPETVRRLFRRTVAVGEAFGVVKVLGGKGVEVEVATFRIDAAYTDGRRPDGVVFCSAAEDAKRRDLTINGIFHDPIAGAYVDYVDGQADLSAGIIRAIGNPMERFQEDKLRLLRAARFAARFRFAIEPATAAAIVAMAPQLGIVSAERILMELRLMLEAPSRGRSLALLSELRLAHEAFPELHDDGGAKSEWQLGCDCVAGLPSTPVTLPLAIAALFSAADESRSPAFFERLKAPNYERDRAGWLAQRRNALDAAESMPMHSLKRLFAAPGRDELLDLHRALALADTRQSLARVAANDFARALHARLAPEEIDPPPLLTGDDLIGAGFPPGPAFRTILDAIRDRQLDGELIDKENAMAYAAELFAAAPK